MIAMHSERSLYSYQWYIFPFYCNLSFFLSLPRTPEIGQGLGRILSCGARKPEQT